MAVKENRSAKDGSFINVFLAPFIENPNPEVGRVRREPLEEVIKEAAATFREPQCPDKSSDCYEIHYLDAFDWTRVADFSRRIMPSAFWNSEELGHLGEGIRSLLVSYRFAEWAQVDSAVDSPFAPAAVPILLGESYLGRALEELKKANATQGIFGRLAMLKNDLEISDPSKSQREILLELNNIILGYLYYFMQTYEEMPLSVYEPAPIEGEPPAKLPEPDPPPQKPEKDELPPLPKPPVKHGRPKWNPKRQPPKAIDIGDLRKKAGNREIPKPDISPPKREGDFKKLSKDLGGRFQRLKAGERLYQLINPRLTLKEPTKHYQILFQIDASGSMRDDVEMLAEDIEKIMEHARAQLKPGGSVSFAIRYYVDDTSKHPVHLDKFSVLEERAKVSKASIKKEIEEARDGLKKAIEHIRTVGGGLEYHWDELMKSINEEPWADKDEEVERVIFLLTDEPGDIGQNNFTVKDVRTAATKKDIRLETVWAIDPASILAKRAKEKLTEENAKNILSYPIGWSYRFSVEDRLMALENLRTPYSVSDSYIRNFKKALDPNIETNNDVRALAVEITALPGNTSVIPLLLPLLDPEKERSLKVRAAAARALKNFGSLASDHGIYMDRRILGPLVRAADPEKEPDATVRMEAIQSLTEIRTLAVLPYLDAILAKGKELSPENRQLLVGALQAPRYYAIKISDIPHGALIKMLDPAFEPVASIRADVLAVLDGEAFDRPEVKDALAVSLEKRLETDPENRKLTVKVLAMKQDSRAIPYLKSVFDRLNEPDPEERIEIVDLLGIFPDPAVTPLLFEHMKSNIEPDAGVRMKIVKLLSYREDPDQLIPFFAKLLRKGGEPNKGIRKKIWDYLYYANDPQVIPYFSGLRRNAVDESIRLSADHKLKYENWAHIKETRAYLTLIIQRKNMPDPEVRKIAAEVMGYSPHLQFIPFLIDALNPELETDIGVRRQAASSLDSYVNNFRGDAFYKERNAINPDYLNIEHYSDRLSEISDSSIFLTENLVPYAPHLIESLDPNREPDAEIRINVAKVLKAILKKTSDETLIPYIERSLDPVFEPDPEVRRIVGEILQNR